MKLLLADDHPLFIDGFSIIINSAIADSEVISVDSWEEALCTIKQQHFDIAFLDLSMSDAKPWQEQLSTFRSLAPDLPVCIVSASNNQTHVQQAFKLGVKGYIYKTSVIPEVQKALSKILNGGHYVPQASWHSLPSPVDSANLNLTWRQREILLLIADGNTNKYIAKLLDITESTVKRHVYNLFKALGAKNRIDAIQIAKSNGILVNQ